MVLFVVNLTFFPTNKNSTPCQICCPAILVPFKPIPLVPPAAGSAAIATALPPKAATPV